jgi:hypothetical protein
MAAAFAALLLFCASARADGTLIPAPERVDFAYDVARGVVYVSEGDRVLRYDAVADTFLSPIIIGGSAGAIDLSPNGNTIAVADWTASGNKVRVFLVDLDTLQVSALIDDRQYMEGSAYSVAFASDGALLVASRFDGSGWVPLRRFDIAHGSVAQVDAVRQNTMLAASGDRKTIAFVEPNISDGRWGLYDVPTGQLVRRQGYEDGTSRFNFEIATDQLGAQFSIPTYGGMYVYDDAYQHVATIGEYAAGQPIGVAYDPLQPLMYVPWGDYESSREVRIYSTETFAQVGAYDFEDDFKHTGNTAFVQGRTKVSADGSLLMVSVTGGVRIVGLGGPLGAAPLSIVNNRWLNSVRLAGAIGNGGKLTYSVASQPAHGKAVVHGNYATYIPYGNYRGADSFRYRVHYGQATVEAVVTVNAAAAVKALQQPAKRALR